MKSIFLTVFLSVVLSAAIDEQRKHHVSTSLNIKYPKDLRIDLSEIEEGYKHTDALFGVPFVKNRSVVGSVLYLTADIDKAVETKNGCEDYSTTITDGERQLNDLIYLIDRGGCSFADKTAFAQTQGAAGVIIASDECLKSDIDYFEKIKVSSEDITTLCCKQSFVADTSTYCTDTGIYSDLPFMITSSSIQTRTIQIPAMLMTLTDTLKLKFCLCESQQSIKDSNFCKSDFLKGVKKKFGVNCGSPNGVVAEMKLDTPHPDGTVHLELWMKPEKQPALLTHLEWFTGALAHKTKFNPNYIVHQPIQCQGGEDGENDICKGFCKTVAGRQICYLPDTDNLELTGVAILDEIVRQICVFNENPNLWWSYQTEFKNKNCVMLSESKFKDCSEEIIDNLGVTKAVEKCKDKEEDILKDLNERQENYGIFTTSVVINSRVMHFSLEAEEVGKRVCDGYASHTLPHVCSCVLQAGSENEFRLCHGCVEKKNCEDIIDSEQKKRSDDVEKKASNKSLFFVLVFLSALVAAAFIYTKQAKKEMRAEMRSLMQEYVPLEESESHFEQMMGRSSAAQASDREDSNLI